MADSKRQEPTARISSVRAVLFDLDGTLIDTVALIRTSMRHATEAVLGVSLSDAELMRNVGIPLVQQMRLFSEGHADELVTAYRAHNAEIHDELIAAYPGVEEALESLVSDGIPLGIVTSKSRAVACRGIDYFGLGRFFEVVVCSDDVTQHKPDPHPLRVAARELGLPIEVCMYVGDSPHDMTAAIRAGAVSVAALWGAFAREAVLEPGPEFVLASIGELSDLLGGNVNPYVVTAVGVGEYEDGKKTPSEVEE